MFNNHFPRWYTLNMNCLINFRHAFIKRFYIRIVIVSRKLTASMRVSILMITAKYVTLTIIQCADIYYVLLDYINVRKLLMSLIL